MSTSYIVRFVVIMTTIVALTLSGLSLLWGPQINENEAVFNKKSILSAVKSHLGEGKDPKTMSDEEVIQIFEDQMEQIVLDMSGNQLTPEQVAAKGYPGGKAENVDMAKEKKKPEADRILPLYIFNTDSGKFYILSVRGKGLWDEIWGCIALESDLNTIAGTAFDHKGETPGLGAEIKDNPSFPKKFMKKEIYTEGGKLVAISVVKNGSGKNPHAIDGISGATVTSVGVEEMMKRGIKYYEPYLNSVRGTKKSTKG